MYYGGVKRGINGHFLNRLALNMEKRLWYFIVAIIIIVIASFVTHEANVPVENPVVEESIEQLEEIKLKDFPVKEEKVVLTPKPPEPVKKVVIPPKLTPAPVIAGNKQDWLRASGIPESSWGYVDSIVSRESGWNPNAVNPSSGACGLGQQLPCGKWAGAWNDPVAALIAMNGYVSARYGGWAGAINFWNSHHWY